MTQTASDAWVLIGAVCAGFFIIGLLGRLGVGRGSGPDGSGSMIVTGIVSAVFLLWLTKHGGTQ